jgi:hypothetical protein
MAVPGRIGASLIVVALLAPRAAGTQTATADGARALVRGDYETAVRLLDAPAGNASQPDPLAQFFLAMLYASGYEGGDRTTACALYRSAAIAANPLANQSLALQRAFEQELGSLAPLCAGRLSPDYRFLPSTSFTLGPDHSITMDRSGATVGYGGAVKHSPMTNGGAGLVFLPLRYIALDVSQPASMRRHFIEMFAWSQDRAADEQAWTLSWVVFEVVGVDVLPVAGTGTGSAMRIIAHDPPASLDLDTIVQVLVGASGEAEWIVPTTPPRRGVIPVRVPR